MSQPAETSAEFESDEIKTEVERRGSSRAPMVVRVAYSTVDALFSEFTRNINEGGLFIETDKPATPDTRVSLQFQLPGTDEPFEASGRVTRVQEAHGDEPAGMGVEFDQLEPESRRRIDALVRTLRSG